MATEGRDWRRLLDQVELQRQLQERQLAAVDSELAALTAEFDELLAAPADGEAYDRLCSPFLLRRLDRLRHEIARLTAGRAARLEQIRSADARSRVVETKLSEARSWEERQAQQRSIEEATLLRLVAEPSSLAQENEPKS